MRSGPLYEGVVRVVSGLLYGYDPGGMGSSVFAPEDEYDGPARLLVGAASGLPDRDEVIGVIRGHYPGASDRLCEAIAGAVWLYDAAKKNSGS